MHLADYSKGLSQADSANVAGSFVAMYGMEWGEIASGGHVIVYGFDKLIGWEAGNYNIFNAQTNYAGLFSKVNANAGAFAYLAHPSVTDFDTLFTKPYRASADSAVVGMPIRSGPAFSTNTTYSNPSTSSFEARYKEALQPGRAVV